MRSFSPSSRRSISDALRAPTPGQNDGLLRAPLEAARTAPAQRLVRVDVARGETRAAVTHSEVVHPRDAAVGPPLEAPWAPAAAANLTRGRPPAVALRALPLQLHVDP